MGFDKPSVDSKIHWTYVPVSYTHLDFKRVYEKALNFVFIIACPLTIYFILFAKEGIFFLSGKLYEGAIIPVSYTHLDVYKRQDIQFG